MDTVLEAGAEDIKNENDYFEIICPMTNYDAVSQALSDRKIETEESDLVYLPNILVPINDKETARKYCTWLRRWKTWTMSKQFILTWILQTLFLTANRKITGFLSSFIYAKESVDFDWDP